MGSLVGVFYMSKVLFPTRKSFKVNGSLSYKNGVGWNLIRLKKEILQDYSQLKDRNKDFDYTMAVYVTYKEIRDVLDELEKGCKALPILLFFKENLKGGG